MQALGFFNQYDKVMHLHSERTEWTLRVRAQSIWKSINRQTQEFRGLNVIFIDEEVTDLIFKISEVNIFALPSEICI